MSAEKLSTGQVLRAMLGEIGADPLLVLEDDAQAVIVLEHHDLPQLVLGALDRNLECTAVTVDVASVRTLRDSLTMWLERQP